MEIKKIILIIMDGWGLGKIPASDAIAHAHTPYVDSLFHKYPNTTLVTCGEAVGLPDGQMGNSEVGHLNLGAGRIVYQELQRINVAIRNKTLDNNSEFLKAIEYAKKNDKYLHLMGLVSDGGVHSHISHLKALLSICADHGLKKVLVHAFTDGRDTDPKSGLGYISDLLTHMKVSTGELASVTGRYFAMDRDKRWERIKVAYDALVHGAGVISPDMPSTIQSYYDKEITDEFLTPIINANLLKTKIEEEDVVICFNFRTDRCREITEVLTQTNYMDYEMAPLSLYYCTMTEYDQSFRNVHTFFQTDNLDNTLGEVLAANGKTQLRIAETEKYPHVSFFFSGGREIPFQGEKRRMIPSPKVATYDLQPEMSAVELTAAVIEEMETEKHDFICLNFANADMVGHTGVWEAVIKAVETVDLCVQQVVETALKLGYGVLLTADHGNADYEINSDGSPNTAHTTNPVPLFFIDENVDATIKSGKLGDIAPTILTLMKLPVPPEMTGDILV